MFERTYGVEIEIIAPPGIYGAVLANAITAAGISCTSESYNHSTRNYWKIVSDSSIKPNGLGTGLEVVSPPLRGLEGFEQIDKVCAVLKDKGCRVNKTCGLHVHVDARRPVMELPALKRLAMLYAENEIIIDQLMPKSRRGNENAYCRSIRRGLNKIDNASSVDALQKALGVKKYVKLNLAPYHSRGTVEFRHHSGTVEAGKITKWVSACLRMVKCAADERVAETITVERVSREARAVRAGSKTAIIHALLTRPEGCTTAEVLAATGWRQVSVAGVGHNLGLTVRQIRERENGRRVIRYFGDRSAAPVSLPTQGSPAARRNKLKNVEEFANFLGMTEEEKAFWSKRQAMFASESDAA